jgi:hypothetical protein
MILFLLFGMVARAATSPSARAWLSSATITTFDPPEIDTGNGFLLRNLRGPEDVEKSTIHRKA